ncbi:MAG: class I SAM-dependent methyltransferase [Bacteroidota bacterium]
MVSQSNDGNHNDWFSNWFDSPYYHILYKNRDYKEAEHFINQMADFLNFQSRDKILDLACGRGRHSIYLNKKGLNVVGLDLSPKNIAFARQFENKRLRFYVHDMRQVFEECCFDFVLNLFTSFGYFNQDSEDIKVIKASTENLKSGGRVIIDFLNPPYVAQKMIAYEEKLIDGINFQISKKIEQGFIIKTIQFEDQNRHYEYQERVKAINYEKFMKYFEASQLDLIHVFGNYMLQSYDQNSSERMIFILEKK